jgi:hypothetical protein
MRVRFGLAAFVLFTTVSGHALAAPATPDQAARITASLQSYVKAEPGVITVTPNGEAYDLKVDFNPLLARANKADAKGQMSPWNMKLVDQGSGKWQVTQDEPVSLSFKSPGATDFQLTIGKISSSGVFDEALGAFASSSAAITDVAVAQSTMLPNEPPSQVSYTFKSGKVETNLMPSAAGGADGTAKITFDQLSETISMPLQPGQPPVPVTITAKSGSQDVSTKGIMIKPLQEALIWMVANAGTVGINAKQPELKKHILDAFPLFQNITSTAGVKEMVITTPYGPIGIATASVDVDMNGAVAEGQFGEGITIEGLTLPPGVVPPFANDLVPQKFTVNVKVADFNLADAAKTFIEQVDFASKADLPPELSARLMSLLLPSGAATISTSGTSAQSKVYDLSVDGSMKAGPQAKPFGSATVKLKGFDAVMQALQSAPPEMGLQQAVGGLLVAKGMAKQEGDALNWTIEATPQGGVLVNGLDVSKMGGGGG